NRIADFFGPEIGDNLIPIESEHDGVRLFGFVCDPQVTRSHNRMQYLFLNGRYIRDRSLQHALTEAYRGLIMTGRFPVCFLRLNMPFDAVDVNVHPAKLEVRFQDGGRLYSQLLGTLRNKFLSTDLTAKGQLSSRENSAPTLPGQVAPPLPYPDEPRRNAFALRPAQTESQSRMEFRAPTASRNFVDRPFHAPPTNIDPLRTRPGQGPYVGSPQFMAPSATSNDAHTTLSGFHASDASGDSAPVAAQPNRVMAMQVQDTYLITETDEGMVIIDQHALHERVLYEQFKEKIFGGKLESQKLLVPEPVTLPAAEVAAVLEKAEMLARVGMTVEPFGGDTVLVSSYPAMLAKHNPAEMLRSVIDKLMTDGSDLGPEDLLDELLHMFACKAAIKAGDRLSREEIQDLIAFRDLCRDAHHCPHGRPTALVFSREDLDKKFKRI
ncbi:MAG: DNA mismatch repair endonuclease MutL, partial [Pirellulaceae bacterium]